MLLISVFRVSPFLAHARARHIDHHQWPARDWLVAEWDVYLSPQEDARAAVLATAKSLLDWSEDDGDEVQVGVYEQLPLPLELPPERPQGQQGTG